MIPVLVIGRHVFFAIVDPGVGAARDGIVVRVDGRSFVGPDHGLLSIVWSRGAIKSASRITAWPDNAVVSFHGRDVFAPMAAAVVTGEFPNENVQSISAPQSLLPAADLAEIIYVDHYGNAVTGCAAKGCRSTAACASAAWTSGTRGCLPMPTLDAASGM